MLSQTTEYAFRAMWFLARHRPAPQVILHIAQGTEVSRDYLYKVLQLLVRGRLVRSRRGKGGGYVLARAPDAITLFDIAQASNLHLRSAHCPLSNRAYCVNNERGGTGMCPLHAAMDAAAAQFEQRLIAIRLSDLLRRIHTPRQVAGDWAKPPPAAHPSRPQRSSPRRTLRRPAARVSPVHSRRA